MTLQCYADAVKAALSTYDAQIPYLLHTARLLPANLANMLSNKLSDQGPVLLLSDGQTPLSLAESEVVNVLIAHTRFLEVILSQTSDHKTKGCFDSVCSMCHFHRVNARMCILKDAQLSVFAAITTWSSQLRQYVTARHCV